MASSQKVEETLNSINTYMGVLGVIIVNIKCAVRGEMETIEYENKKKALGRYE